MNKTLLVAQVAIDAGITKVAAENAVNSVLSTITSTLKAGDSVALLGFGTFKSTKRNARTGRNPATGKEIAIAARVAPTFTAGKALKDALN